MSTALHRSNSFSFRGRVLSIFSRKGKQPDSNTRSEFNNNKSSDDSTLVEYSSESSLKIWSGRLSEDVVLPVSPVDPFLDPSAPTIIEDYIASGNDDDDNLQASIYPFQKLSTIYNKPQLQWDSTLNETSTAITSLDELLFNLDESEQLYWIENVHLKLVCQSTDKVDQLSYFKIIGKNKEIPTHLYATLWGKDSMKKINIIKDDFSDQLKVIKSYNDILQHMKFNIKIMVIDDSFKIVSIDPISYPLYKNQHNHAEIERNLINKGFQKGYDMATYKNSKKKLKRFNFLSYYPRAGSLECDFSTYVKQFSFGKIKKYQKTIVGPVYINISGTEKLYVCDFCKDYKCQQPKRHKTEYAKVYYEITPPDSNEESPVEFFTLFPDKRVKAIFEINKQLKYDKLYYVEVQRCTEGNARLLCIWDKSSYNMNPFETP
ncbi:hypothetical protein DAMA08_025050 [Martiniozyma asiatica (nom. inval.)]|nr:hypothetical protein DAMA08_025050 [Martiniozyma asiatica]